MKGHTSSNKNDLSDPASGGNINFEKWLHDAPLEVISPRSLPIQGTIPSYVHGSLIRNGPAQWTTNGNDETAAAGSSKPNQRYAHAFDGLAKLTRYEISGSVTGEQKEEEQQKVLFSTKFIDSKYRDAVINKGEFLEGIRTGPRMNNDLTQILDFSLLKSLWNSISFDNTPVNVWDFGQGRTKSDDTIDNHHPNVYAITDAPTRAHIDPTSLDTKKSARPPSMARNAGGYELFATAHPEYCKCGSGDTYNVIVELNPIMGNRVSIVKEYPKEGSDNDGTMSRKIVASCTVPVNARGIPYSHSFGLTETKAMVILQPLRLNLKNLSELLTKGFLSTMEDEESTRVIVFDIQSGETLANVELDEPIYFYHSISCAESDQDSSISMKICGYQVPDFFTGKDQFFRFDRAQSAEGRNRIHRGGKICDVNVNLNDGKAEVKWTDVTVKRKDQKVVKQGFELPTTRYSRWSTNNNNDEYCPLPWKNGRHPKFAYAFGSHALGCDSYDAWTLLKINLDDGEATPLRERHSCYYSEPIFVANPKGKEEDDGILLCQRYDGVTDQTSLLVIDAKEMSVLAEADAGMRNAMDFHGVFIPSK